MSLLELFFFFFRISAVTFGGGIVILGMVQLEAEKRGDIGREELVDMISLAASMPGPLAVSISWLVGVRYRGFWGGVAAVLGAILPPFIIILLLSPLILKYSSLPAVRGFFRGVLAGTGAIIASVVFDNTKKTLSAGWFGFVPFIAVMAMIGVFHIHPFFAILASIALQLAAEKTAIRK